MKELIMHNLISALGLAKLPQKKQEELLEEMGEALYRAVLLRVMDELDEEGKRELEALLTDGSDATADFMSKKIPNFDAIIREEVERITNEGLTIFGESDHPSP